MTYTEKLREYEEFKKELQKLNLTSAEYEKRCREKAKELGI